MSSTSELINSIQYVFINSGDRKIRLTDIQLQLDITSTPINLIELNKILQSLKTLFSFIHIGIDLAVSIDISLKACPTYNLLSQCPSPLDCPYLHVCEKQVKSVNGCNGPCKLNHEFDPDEIKKKLIDEKFDLKTLMKFYQTFYQKNHDETATSDDSVILEENCPIELRRVMVKLPEPFPRLQHQKYFYDLFARKENTGGGFIEKLEYKPNEQHAIITFQKMSTAERLLKKRDVHSDGFMFTVTKVDEQKSTSDYISSKPKSRNQSVQSISTSKSVYQPSSHKRSRK